MNDNNKEECLNCAALGLRNVDGRLVVPCTNCAIDNDCTWDGLENFGTIDGLRALTFEEFVIDTFERIAIHGASFVTLLHDFIPVRHHNIILEWWWHTPPPNLRLNSSKGG